MLSIIICSKNDAKFSAVATNYTRLLENVPHEIVRIPDAKSICEGYNRGIAQSRGEHLIFSHDDIEILSPNFAENLKNHLTEFDIVGIAGTNRLIGGAWITAGPPYVFGQVSQLHQKQGFAVLMFNSTRRTFSNMHALDGVFLATHRRVIQQIPFDAQTFDGFHHYDLDFTFAAHLAGLRLGVACDIHIIHSSSGNFDENWERSSERFKQKYAGKLHPMRIRSYNVASVDVNTKREVREVMAAGYSI